MNSKKQKAAIEQLLKNDIEIMNSLISIIYLQKGMGTGEATRELLRTSISNTYKVLNEE